MGTPVAVTNPIRMKDSHHHEPRLPREILKKYEAKSREVNSCKVIKLLANALESFMMSIII